MISEYRVCNRCIMDTSDPEIVFDEKGNCNHCRGYDEIVAQRLHPPEVSRKLLEGRVAEMKRAGVGREYDCILGLSGGVDSSYLAWLCKEHGLRSLAVHLDCGWDSEIAVKNIESLVTLLNIDLFTFVVDWEEMRDLQLAFIKSGVKNCDIPTDHAIVAALYKVAAQHKIRYIVSGSNLATEAVLPRSWGYRSEDLTHLRAIQRRFGEGKLRQYPQLGFYRRFFWYRFVRPIKMVRLLDYVQYDKSAAMAVLRDKLAWRYYGGKHYESQFTKFYQAYYLPRRFGIDKRRAHLSNLVCSRQMTREEALVEIQSEPCSPEEARNARDYVIKKLGISDAEFERIVAEPERSHRDLPSEEWLFKKAERVRALFASASRAYGRRG